MVLVSKFFRAFSEEGRAAQLALFGAASVVPVCFAQSRKGK